MADKSPTDLAMIELHKDWAAMSTDERQAFLRTATEQLYGPGTFTPAGTSGPPAKR